MLFCFFFFKQKTAYEMRISDWSSDVCSSDLIARGDGSQQLAVNALTGKQEIVHRQRRGRPEIGRRIAELQIEIDEAAAACSALLPQIMSDMRGDRGRADRSEEHTSELQSLMSISYAVFCLKKKHKYKTC